MKRCKECGFLPCRCEDLRAGYMGNGHLPACWPQKSEALAVHPDQIGEATEVARQKGVPTEHDPQGRPIFTDRNHRKRYCAAFGYFDRGAGYGDQSPTGRKAPPVDPKEYEKASAGLRETINGERR